jgi:hypothetical protein
VVDVNTAGIINTAISALPGIIGLVRQQHAATNPGAPPLTDEQVKAALRDAVAQSLAQDDDIEADVRRRNTPPTQG